MQRHETQDLWPQLSEHTVKYHMGEILQRLHLKNREQVVAYARRSGLAP